MSNLFFISNALKINGGNKNYKKKNIEVPNKSSLLPKFKLPEYYKDNRRKKEQKIRFFS